RDRREDIPLLAQHFLSNDNKLMRSGMRILEADARRLSNYNWPGNARELQNVIERAAILSRDGRLRIDLPDDSARENIVVSSDVGVKSSIRTDAQMREDECRNIAAALEVCNGQVFGEGGAAKLLGMRPTTLSSRIKALNLKISPRKR
ncbi:MAG: histidine kinase, partial [Hyphomicrobiales bacterium]